MITREFNLYLHAGHSIPLVINANQYDHGEQWLFKLFNSDGTQYVPSSGAIVGIKSDNLGIINTGSVDVQGRVVINETQQMTAAVGKAVFELVIDEGTHGTANFVVLVEEKPGNNADLSETDISMIEEAIEAASTIKPYGSPLVASTVAGMTDHEKVYVYVGSETGYTSGNWYYWDGSAWTSGGVYNSVAVQTDTTLTLSGVAADSKKVGDEISDLKSQISSAFNSFKDFLNHLNASFDDENGDSYIQTIIDAIDAIGTGGGDDPTPPTPEEPTVELVFCETPFSSASTHLYTDEGSTSKTDLKTSNGIYYYLEDAATENTVYNVKISVNTNLNSHQYKAMYAYSAELLSGAGTNDPTIYNITNLESAGIFDSSKSRLTEDSIYETQMTVKADRQLAVLFYRNQSTCINSITAQKVVE